MDDPEFLKRVYADPENPGQEVVDSAARVAARAAILAEARAWDRELRARARAVEPPADLHSRLSALPDSDHRADPSAGGVSSAGYQYFALAASLVLAVGFALSIDWRSSNLPAEIAMGNSIVEHLYHEEAEMSAIRAGELAAEIPWTTVNRVLANAGASLAASAQLGEIPVRYAKPCLVVPGQQSAHLILQAATGPLNVIVIDSSPIERDLRIGDDQFSGMIIPLERGNLALIGETGEDVDRYRDLFVENIDWVGIL